MFVGCFFGSRAPWVRSGARLLGCLLVGVLSHAAPAQTALIAHRSHGGAARTFVPDASVDNFGRVPMDMEHGPGGRPIISSPEEGEKLTVTKVVRRANGIVYRYGTSDVQGAVVDTFSRGFPFTDPNFTTKDARAYFGPGVEIVGFDRKARAALRAKNPATRPGPSADTSRAKASKPPKKSRRSQLLPPHAALPSNTTGPTLLLVLASVATAGVCWRLATRRPALA